MQFLNENEQEQSGIGMDEERERRVLHADNLEQLALLFGSLDENIETVAQRTGARIGSVGTEITVTGTREQADLACTVLEKLIAMLRRNEKIDKSRINYAVELAKEGNADMIDAIMQDVIAITARGRQVRCKTLGQRNYVKAVRENVVTFAVGPAGTGKTYLAMAMAVVAFKNKEVERIILTRPAVEAGEKLGFLPGDLQNKVDPYLRPLYDALYELMGVENFQKYLERGVIEVAPLAYMRGRTLNDSYIILDEAQNTTCEQMKMFLTRFGENSRVIVTGDLTQIDLPVGKKSGLKEAVEVLRGVDDIAVCELTHRDVVRHSLVQAIVKAYEKYEKKNER